MEIITRLLAEQKGRPPDPFNMSMWSPELQELFRPPYDIMSPLLWDEARAEGKKKKKWIMFNLQDMMEFRCHALNRDIWREPMVKEMIQQNFIFLHCLKDDPPALQYMTVYFPHRSHRDTVIQLPHVSIVDPFTGEQVWVWSGEPFPKFYPWYDFLLQLDDFLIRHSLAADGEEPVAETANRSKVTDLNRMTEEEKLEMAPQIEWEPSNSSSSASRPGLVDPDLYTPSRSTPTEKGKEPAYGARAAEDPSDSAQYQYTDLTRLEELFRLLTLHPASERKATIECSLAIAALPRFSCTYEALSYCWGPQSTEHRIKVDDCWVNVTSNLHNALQRLRYDARPRTLWIDAICINQANPEEKNHQVKQMRAIYSCASRVLIWLGESDEDVDTALEYLQRPGVKSLERLDALVKILRNQGSAEILLNEGSVPTETDMLLVRGLRKLYNKPWWTRMWVVQELFAAAVDPLVICGDKTIDWWLLSDLLGEISRQRLIDGRIAEVSANTFSSFRLYLRAGSLRHESSSNLTLEHLLDGTQAHDATDSRDHVYALLGLVSDDRAELFQADYRRPVQVAYQHAMVHMFRSRQDLALLANASGEDAVDIPSWCIDFSSKNWRYDALESGVSSEEWRTSPAASRGRGLVEIFHDMEAGTIRLHGTRVGIIHHTVESTTRIMRQLRPAYRTTSPEDLKSAPVKDIEKLLNDIGTFHFLACLALDRRYGEDATARKVAAGDIWKIAAGGLEFNSLLDQEAPLPSGQNGFGSLENFAQRFNPGRAGMLRPWSQHLPAEPINFEPLARSALTKIALFTGNKSCYFTTDESFIGLAYHPVQKGDILCILF